MFLLQRVANCLLDPVDELIVRPLLLELLVIHLPSKCAAAVDGTVIVPHQDLHQAGSLKLIDIE